MTIPFLMIMPDPSSPVSRSWISALPPSWQAYAELARLDKPAGFMLLLLPAWWAVVLATPQGTWPDVGLLALFFAGAVVMRAAGCAVNDALDYKMDAMVERTRNRPIARGALSPMQGFVFAALCTVIGFVIVLQMKALCFWLALASLPLIIMYPLMKRVTWWPQAFLGIIFNWGCMMGFAAVTGDVPLAAFVLWLACFFWTLSYDTIYAFQDVTDDGKAGIKSSALRLADKKNAKRMVMAWAGIAVLGIIYAGYLCGMQIWFYIGMVGVTGYGVRMLMRWQPQDKASCRATFNAHVPIGLLVWAVMIIGRVF